MGGWLRAWFCWVFWLDRFGLWLTLSRPLTVEIRSFEGDQQHKAPSSRGLGHRPFTAVTRVRLPSGSLGMPSGGLSPHHNPANRWVFLFSDFP